MTKSTDTSEHATANQILESESSQPGIQEYIIVNILTMVDRQFYLYSTPLPRGQISITNASSHPPLSQWTFYRLEGEQDTFHIRSYPDNHLYLTYDAGVQTVRLRDRSGNDDQKWLVLQVDPGPDRGVYYICNIVRLSSYMRVNTPLYNNAPVVTEFNLHNIAERFTLEPIGITP
ncbi:hypothetical protein ACW9IK_13980 [Pseudomonas gingeri]